MLPLIILILSTAITESFTKPTTESTHSLLQRLGFDQIHKPVINYHKKRVAQETNKARHHIDGYNTETDSHMFIVKLPPHYPYYSHMTPQKFENEVVSKASMNFLTNGKPNGVYHWNIPVIKKLPQSRFGTSRISEGNSKVYHVKILSKDHAKDNDRPYKKFSKLKKQRYENTSNTIKHKNSVRLYRVKSPKDELVKKVPEHGETEFAKDKAPNDIYTLNKNYMHDKMNESLVRDAAKAKDKRQRSPTYYQPALPKQNSFHKDFTGNGKPKSFYVIEKSNKATRYHRLF